MAKSEEEVLRKWKGTNEYATAKSWHEIFIEDAKESSKKLKEKEFSWYEKNKKINH